MAIIIINIIASGLRLSGIAITLSASRRSREPNEATGTVNEKANTDLIASEKEIIIKSNDVTAALREYKGIRNTIGIEASQCWE